MPDASTASDELAVPLPPVAYHTLTVDQVATELATDPVGGLNAAEAA